MTARRLPPPHAIVTRFFRERHPRPADEVAELLGWPLAEVRRAAEDRGALTAEGLVRWDAAAVWVLEAWPLATLLRTLGRDAALLPAGLHPVPLPLELPAYLVQALRTQSRIERMPHRVVPPADFTEYMTDLVHRAIAPETVEALRDDVEFVRAWNFAGEGDDDA
ncbi:MAG TPA: hypothetical protein VF432_13425 [Thermoanaerobaculia bacterium]